MILETKWNRLEIFCYGDRSHIRVQLHMKYYLGAAKLVVTGGKNVIFWHFRRQNHTIPLRGFSANKIGRFQFLREVMNCKKRFFLGF